MGAWVTVWAPAPWFHSFAAAAARVATSPPLTDTRVSWLWRMPAGAWAGDDTCARVSAVVVWPMSDGAAAAWRAGRRRGDGVEDDPHTTAAAQAWDGTRHAAWWAPLQLTMRVRARDQAGGRECMATLAPLRRGGGGRGGTPVPRLLLRPYAWSHLDRSGSDRFIALENRLVALQSANAYISTLGGGHFLCRHVPTAIRLARAQIAVATQLGDACLAARCHVHLVYCHIQLGNFLTAHRMLATLRRIATHLHDEVCLGMVTAGKRHLHLTHAMWKAGALRMTHVAGEAWQSQLGARRRRAGGGGGGGVGADEGMVLAASVAPGRTVGTGGGDRGGAAPIHRHDELYRLHLVQWSPE